MGRVELFNFLLASFGVAAGVAMFEIQRDLIKMEKDFERREKESNEKANARTFFEDFKDWRKKKERKIDLFDQL